MTDRKIEVMDLPDSPNQSVIVGRIETVTVGRCTVTGIKSVTLDGEPVLVFGEWNGNWVALLGENRWIAYNRVAELVSYLLKKESADRYEYTPDVFPHGEFGEKLDQRAPDYDPEEARWQAGHVDPDTGKFI